MYLALVRSTEVGDKKLSRHFEVISKNRDILEQEVKTKVKKYFVNKTTKYKITSFIKTKEIDKTLDMNITRITALIVTIQGYSVRTVEIEIQEVEQV